MRVKLRRGACPFDIAKFLLIYRCPRMAERDSWWTSWSMTTSGEDGSPKTSSKWSMTKEARGALLTVAELIFQDTILRRLP